MEQEKGNLSINSENFLPIIKKWLYTDKDIFIREIVSNGCDAVTKLKKLMVMGEADNIAEEEKFSIHVVCDTKDKIIQVIDNGIGMTADEIKKYINQIAFSGATDFLSKFGEKQQDEGNEIIGHFGLGFYSAFMVADKVEIDSLSYKEGSESAKWICNGGIDYEMEKGTRTVHGTTITMHLGEDGEEFADEASLYKALKKYCEYMPVEIYFDTIGEEESEEIKGTAEEKTDDTSEGATHKVVSSADELVDVLKERAAEKKAENGEEINEEIDEEIDKAKEKNDEPEQLPLNETNPLWLRKPSECTEEQYKELYHHMFSDTKDPLFWIHLNMDYPFRLKGILFFPRLMSDMEAVDGVVKLYSNQVYIADNIKEVIPEFLLILKGVLDCPDIPLNVSRSALQNDGYAAKMSTYITKKVADKINSLFKNEREEYEKFCDDINLFLKYGSMKEEKFYDKIKDSLLFKTTEGKHKTIEEYTSDNKDKNGNKIYYVSDEKQQIQYINLFKSQSMEAVILPSAIDKPFVNFLEYKEESKFTLERIDSDLSDALKSDSETNEDLNNEFKSLFSGIVGNDKLTVKVENLKSESISAMILLSERERRLMDMLETYKYDDSLKSLYGNTAVGETLILNGSNKLIKILKDLKNKTGKEEETKLICRQVYDLALMGQKPLTPEQMTEFIDRSNNLLEKLAENELE
ncbi:Chaperone protein HtpG [bioreactor metagenome]|uniref:Chaperone protein HtpG n=1 Tax=bioreactor metagenome TaxID=1076179 RepID=A0A644XAB1_9ZZZZ|nr:molecular chaperone HtpG [Candidatus Metalachnospira sp.]